MKARIANLDFGFIGILTLIVVVAGWLLSMPFCDFVQRSTINRFHFQTRAFGLWAIQQPIPAMYNLYNRFEIRPSPWKRDKEKLPQDSVWEKGTANHFPLRLFTFGDKRAIFLRPDEPRQIDIWSSYRGQELHTRWSATPSEKGGFDLSGEVVK